MSIRSDVTKDDSWISGEDQSLYWDVVQSDGTTPQPMTGWTLRWRLFTKKNGTVLITKVPSIGNGDGTDDRATISVVAADYSPSVLIEKNYYYVLDRTDSSSVQGLAEGLAYIANVGL